MSFPRAKLTRFNEVPPSTPSPADYYVGHTNTTPGGKIPKAERFIDKSPVGSENGSSKSIASTPLFRTPTLPKKKKGIFSSLRKPKSSVNLKETQLDLEVLKDKIVECNNKDSYIQDLTEQIEEMKESLCILEQQKTEIRENEKIIHEQLTKELKEEHKITLETICKKHDGEISTFKEKLKTTEEKLSVELENVEKLKNQCEKLELTQFMIEELKMEIEEKQLLIQKLESTKEELEYKLIKLESEHFKEIETLKNSHKEEIVEMEYSMLKSVSEIQALLDKEKSACKIKIKDLMVEFEVEKNRLLEEADARVKQVEEDCKEANVLAEMQMQEKCKDIELTWKLKLENQEKESDAILKECQAISEYSIIQCEVEKNSIKTDLVRKLEEIDSLQKSNADLMIAHKKLELKYADLEETLECTNRKIEENRSTKKIEMENYNKELQEVVNQKKLYEISIQKSHETIETLKKRLLDSDRDVEQLKEEIEMCELSKLEYQGKCNQLSEELEIVAKLNENLEIQYEAMIKKTEDRIDNLQRDLLKKIDDYNEQAKIKVEALNMELDEKDSLLDDALKQLHQQQDLNSKAQELILAAREEIEDFNERNVLKNLELCRMKSDCEKSRNQIFELQETIEQLQVENKDLLQKLDGLQEDNVNLRNSTCDREEVEGLVKKVIQLQEKAEQYSQYCDYYKIKAGEYEQEIEQLEGINKKYIEQSGKYDELLQKYEMLEKKNSALEKKVEEQNNLIGPFREQLEAYELEHKILMNQKSQAENEARDMGLKYAQALGHQNQKQKIKHLIDLKAKNFELIEDKKELELKLRNQNRIIEKLHKELTALTKSPRKSKISIHDKENIGSPNRTLNSSRVESPGPLRDRN